MRSKEVNSGNIFMLNESNTGLILGLYDYILTNSTIDLIRLVSKI